MRVLDAQLAMLRVAKAQGQEVDDQIADVLIAMVKEAYVRGEVEIDHLERTVEAILRSEPVALLAEGGREFVLRGDSVIVPATSTLGAVFHRWISITVRLFPLGADHA